MRDLLPDFRPQLEARAERMAREHGARRRRTGLHGRALAVAIVGGTLTVSGAAYAAKSIWSPQLGDPLRGAPATAGASPVPPDQLALLGVLRRPQTPQDRGPGTLGALRFQDDIMKGLRLDAVRRLGTTAAGGAVVLLPVEVQKSWDPAYEDDKSDALCLWLTDSVDGGGQGCSSLKDLRAGRMTMSMYGPPPAELRARKARAERETAQLKARARKRGLTLQQYIRKQAGKNLFSRTKSQPGFGRLKAQDQSNWEGDIVQVVPDGVAQVRYHHQGRTLAKPVIDNAVILHLSPWHSTGTTWLDAEGHELHKGSRFPQRKT